MRMREAAPAGRVCGPRKMGVKNTVVRCGLCRAQNACMRLPWSTLCAIRRTLPMNDDRRAVGAPTRELAAWVSGLQYEDIPRRTREVARIAILDTLGCAIHGYGTPWAGMLLKWACAGSAGTGPATVWGEKTASLRVADAAMVNGSAAHAFELDDYHNAKLHAGAVAVPAALAMAEKTGADGRAVVTAIAAGYETMIRASLASNPSATRLRGWHIPGIYGP